jgi:hypothetical protein
MRYDNAALGFAGVFVVSGLIDRHVDAMRGRGFRKPPPLLVGPQRRIAEGFAWLQPL